MEKSKLPTSDGRPAFRDPILNPKAFELLEKRDRSGLPVSTVTFWTRFRDELLANKLAFVSLIILVAIVLASVFAWLSPYDPYALNAKAKNLDPSWEHWFGTDEFGRDYFTRALYGGQVSLTVGFMSMLLTVFIGTTIGVLSGYVGGKLDIVLMRFTDIFLALPSMLLMVILNAFLRPSLMTLVCVLSLFSWASVARITRAETLSLKERDFVVAARNLGAGPLRIAVTHILPNITGPVIVAASLSVASAILAESSLSFLGLGVSIPLASWGSMLQGAQSAILNHPLLAVYPGVLIVLTVLAFNLLGDVMRNALDSKVAR